jgi:hypothetical protein
LRARPPFSRPPFTISQRLFWIAERSLKKAIRSENGPLATSRAASISASYQMNYRRVARVLYATQYCVHILYTVHKIVDISKATQRMYTTVSRASADICNVYNENAKHAWQQRESPVVASINARCAPWTMRASS